MPLRVPDSPNVSRIAPNSTPLSESDVWMALAIMHGKGAFSKLDQSLRGQVEDRSKMNPAQLVAAENQTRRDRLLPEFAEPDKGGIAEEAGLKDISQPPKMAKGDSVEEAFAKMKAKRAREDESASVGVSGGSR